MPKIDTYSLDASITDTDSLLGVNAADGKTKRYAMSAIKTYVASVADIEGVTAGTGLSGGGTSGTVTLTVGAAQTTITSILATDIKIGEDDQTKIDFETADEIHFYAANVEQVYLGDNIFGPQSDSNVDLGSTSVRWKDAFVDSITVTGEVDGASLDISGNADIDGTLEADAITVNGTALNEYIADTVGAMVGSNTETNITVTYEDGDNTLDFVIGTLNQDTSGTAALATSVTASANNSTDETVYPTFVDGATGTQGIETDTGLTYNPSTGLLTSTGFSGNLTGALQTAAQTNVTSLGTLTALTVDNVVIDGAVIGHTSDTDLITLSSGVVTVAGEVDATSLDISGDADIDGTLEADAITVGGSALNTVIAGVTVSNATLAATATVTDSSANTNFPVVFHNESNGLLDDTGALRYNPSTGELLVPKLTVAGATTTVDTVTMNASNAIIFEGATADSNETTLSIVDPTSDHTQYLINQGGYIPVLAAATTTAIAATPAEINLIDGGTARGTTAVASGDGILINDDGTMRMTNVDTVSTYFASHNVGGSNIVTTGALNSGSITSGFGTIDTGSSNITTTGVGSFGSLDISGNVDVDGTMEADAYTVDGTTLAEYIADTSGAMFTSNTETFITATYQDADNTVDLVVPVLDEDDMSTDSASHLATQQSIKAYVDSEVSSPTGLGTITQDTVTFTSANSTDPLIIIKNTTNDTAAARLHFIKDKGAAGADGDDIGTIEFISDDAGQTQTSFAKIVAEVSEADNTDEAGKLSFYVAESDGTNTALTAGLVLEGEHATDGEVDVTVGAGAASTVTVPGHIDLAGDIDVDGTMEADAITVAGTALNEYIADTVGAMVGSNTETGITVTYEDGDNTLDFVLGTITSLGTISTGVWQGTAIASSYIAADAITGAKIADNAIDSEHYTDGSIDNAHLADDAVGADELAANAVVNASIASGAAIDMDKLDGDSLGTAITDFAQDDLVILSDTSDSGNLVKMTASNFEDAIFGNVSGDATVAAGGALTIANQAVENAMLADDAVDSDEIAAGAIDLAHMSVNSIDSDQYVDGSIDNAHIADDAIDSEHYAAGSIDTAHIADDQVTYNKIGVEFTASSSVSSASTIAIDCDTADVYTWTAGHSATLNFTNIEIGMVKSFYIIGGGSSYTMTLGTMNGSSGTWNKITGDYDDTSSKKNLIQIKFISTAIAWYTISQPAS